MKYSFATRLIFTIGAALLLLFVAATESFSASKKLPVPVPVVDYRVMVTGVDVKAGTVVVKTMRDSKSIPKTYHLDNMTLLEINNVKGTIDKIKAGMQVHDLVERDFDSLDILRVGIADPAPGPPKGKK